MDSYVRGSMVIAREGDVLFAQGEDDSVNARLEGYLVMPLELVPQDFLLALGITPDPAALPV